MRKYTLLLGTILLISNAYSQETIQYAKLEDNPELVADRIITASMYGQYGQNTETTVGVNATALFKIQNRLSLIGSTNLGFVNFSDFMSYELEAGTLFRFRTKDKVKDIKVVMEWSDNTSTAIRYNTNDGKTYETTTRSRSEKFVPEKAITRKEMSLRGGLFINKMAFKPSDAIGSGNTPMFQSGVFGGIEHSSKAAVITSINGAKGITSGLTRLYADALITPIDRNNGVKNGFGIGGRGGFAIYMLPSKSVNAKPENMDARQTYSMFFFNSEIGYRPTQGFFFMMGFGVMVFKNR